MQPDLPARSLRYKDDHRQRSEAEPLVSSSQGAPAPPGQAREILDGLASPAARVSPKYFYDRLGSTLFDAITALPEYYLTRTELGLLRRHAIEIRVNAGRALPIIDLGAGNCTKAPLLFAAMATRRYVAIDISGEYLQDALNRLRHRWPEIEISAATGDIVRELGQGVVLPRPAMFSFFGSSIGNFAQNEAIVLLNHVASLCDTGGGLLIGVDLLKDRSELESAYNDALGVTAAFNLNMLNNLNRLAGTDFSVADWRHVAEFDEQRSCISMYLEARRNLVLLWPGGRREFVRGERMHTEDSYKYSLPAFRDLLLQSGFASTHAWLDDKKRFALMYARP